MRPDPMPDNLFPTTIAGSLPKPAWLAAPNKLWAPWRLDGEELATAKDDATLLAIKLQEDAGIDIVGDGEQARQHTRHQLKFTLPGPMTIVDTIADAHYGDRVKMAFAFAALLNEEARGLAGDGVDVIQFDEPAFNVYMEDAAGWGIEALHRAIEGVGCLSAVHICYGYGIPANIEWKATLGAEWRQYEKFFPALANSRIGQVSLECINSRVPISVLKLLHGKDVLIGVIDVATERIETPEEIADPIAKAAEYVPAQKIIASTNCGMAPMRREIAAMKLDALARGAALARENFV